MKVNFLEMVKQKTDKELEIISKDCVFYSEKERFIALNELDSRNQLTEELLISKKDIEYSQQNELNIEIFDKTVSRGKRFLNYLLDLIFIQIFTVILVVILVVVIYIISPESLPIFDNFVDNKNSLLFAVKRDLLLAISWMIYYSLFEGLTGRTLAKYITRTKVVNEKGEKPDFKTILLRSLCRLCPFEPISFFGSEKTGWHDEWSKTTVVKI